LIAEAALHQVGNGLEPAGPGWFVLNAKDVRWRKGVFGAGTFFEGEGDAHFPQLGINIGVLEPGQPMCMYHREEEQEDFLVLSGECLLLVEEQERSLKAWDFVHCPTGTNHVFVGAGTGPCIILSVGSRSGGGVTYPVSELARKHNAGVPKETTKPEEAYAPYPHGSEAPFEPGWLPGY
jgi:uncharacterized cupin superfamily protein